MAIVGLGTVTVPTPGTPVLLAAASLFPQYPNVYQVNIFANSGNSGKILVKILNLNPPVPNNFTSAIADGLAKGTWLNLNNGNQFIDLSTVYIDAADANDGVSGYVIF